MHARIVTNGDDWEALYSPSGDLLYQGHSIEAKDLIKHLGLDIVVEEAVPHGHFPDNYWDIAPEDKPTYTKESEPTNGKKK